MAKQKLPKHIIMMVEKNNMAMAIKTLADEWQINMEDAKTYLDEFETSLNKKRDKKVAAIVEKQKRKGNLKPDQLQYDKLVDNKIVGAENNTNKPLDTKQPTGEPELIKIAPLCSEPYHSTMNNSTANTKNSANALKKGLDQHLNDIGYKKPIMPHWAKRVLVVLTVMAIVFIGLYQLIK